jgi:2Fe-2S ferredoxin
VAKITYIEANGTEHTVDVPVGWTVMQGCVKNSLPGILAECGGNCACGTCRVYVDEAWRAITGESSDLEEATLDIREDSTPGKRLGCQIKVTEEMDGMIVRMPENQF